MTGQTQNRLARAALAAVLAVMIFSVVTSSATAHARLDHSSPLSGAALTNMPETITLTFSEPVAPASVSLALEAVDGTGLTLAGPTMSDGDRSVTVIPEPGNFTPGVFQIRWSVRSAMDGHDSAGLIVFTVGTGRAPATFASSDGQRDAWWLIAIRGIWLLALALIATRIVAGLGVGPRPIAIWGVVGGLTSLLAAVGTIRPWTDFDTSVESVRWLGLAGLSGLISGLASANRNRALVAISSAAWLVAITGIAASGHGAGVSFAIVATAIHVGLALIWLGSLLAITLNFGESQTRRNLNRYSRVTLAGVLALTIAGGILAATGISGQRGLVESTYGRTLLIKLAIVVLVVAIAATNRWVVLPWVDRRPQGSGIDQQSRLVLFTELGALGLVVAIAAALASTAPPADSSLVPVASPLRTIDLPAKSGDLSIRLTAQITGEVDDRISVLIAVTDGQSPADIQRVIIETSFVDEQTGTTVTGERFDAGLVEIRSGKYEFSALRLSRQALWTIEVTVRRTGLLDVTRPFQVDTLGWQGEQPRVAERAWHWPIIPAGAWALLAVAVLLPLAGMFMIRRNGQIAPVSGAILIIALAMIATGFTVQAWQRSPERTAGHDLVAPSAPDLIAAGADYESRCLACHGVNGAGLDELDPLHQHGSGTDLVDPRTIALSDGDLYTLISDGVGDSEMPSFDLALTPEQRWNLVAYLRMLQLNETDP